MKLTILHPQDYKKMPWKNGLGVTTEIAIHPPQSKFESSNFDWRLSTAEINEASYFSEFSGCERTLVITSGNGVRLSYSNFEKILNTNEVFNFDGTEKVHCSLIDGKVQDLGLILKKSHFYSQLQILDKDLDQIELQAGTHIIHVLTGKIRLEVPLGFNTLNELSSAILTVDAPTEASIIINNQSVYALVSIFKKNG